MARKSAILEKLARLPQGSDTWLVAARELRTWVMDEENHRTVRMASWC